MKVKVVKFGGSSLADAKQFKKVKDIIMADPMRVYVVPSAPGKRSYTDEKITDMLYACQKRAAEDKSFDDLYDCIVERYVDIAFELDLHVNIMPHLLEVRERIQNGETADYAASRGEYLNGILLADYLGFDFIDPAEIIRFDAYGKFDANTTQELTSERLAKHKNAVIPGFYGARPNGEIKTFSRGGSDITGAIIARGCNARVYENWTDVSGFLMADPRVVNNPKPISTVTYTELRELAYMGATVLHEESIFPVRQACIPINVRNTNQPDDPGTMILPAAEDYPPQSSAITGIAGRKGFTVITIDKDKINSEIGFAANLLSALAKHNVSIEHMPSGIDTISVVVADSQLEGKRQQVVDEIIKVCEPDTVEISDNLALMAIVGRGMIHRVGTSAKVFTALAENAVNVRMIDQGSSEINIIVGISSDDFSKAVNAVYNAFNEQ